MFKETLLALTALWLANPSLLHAQAPPAAPANPAKPAEKEKTEDSLQQNRFWQANVGGGHYMVALDRISAISRHQYLLDGNIIVDEVTVDALGQALARFYFLRPVTDALTGSGIGNAASRIVDRGREIIEKGASNAGTDVHNMVVKKFPETTHAHTIEYRVLSAEELTGLYSSVRTAWETGKGRKFTIK
jgi:hypothetical protein